MKHLDLCSGIGGFALAARWTGFNTVQFCEIDKWCQRILKKHWPDVPCHNDLKTFDGTPFYGIDILTAGYPCQPFSVAGHQKGEKDPRHLWPEVLRIIRESRPRWIICENVEGHIRLGYDTVHSDLESENYVVWPFIIPASGIGARHQRKRIWIIARSKDVANAESAISKKPVAESKSESGKGFTDSSTIIRNVSDTISFGLQGVTESSTSERKSGEILKRGEITRIRIKDRTERDTWAFEPGMGRVADGVSNRVDRIKGLGNAVVPQIPYLIMETIKDYEQFGKYL